MRCKPAQVADERNRLRAAALQFLIMFSFYVSNRPLCLADGVAADEIDFGELGYAREARRSYQDFCVARDRGDLPPDVRFQVCLPTPMAVTYAYVVETDVLAVYDADQKNMLREVETICAAIPHDDPCIQWDVCHERPPAAAA
jgi:hypothetical protein